MRLGTVLIGQCLLLAMACTSAAAPDVGALPVAPRRELARGDDWLLNDSGTEAKAYRSDDGASLVLDNGLVRRTIRLGPNAATIALDDLRTGASLLRGVRAEARLKIDGKEWNVGGLVGQPDHAYLTPEWVENLQAEPEAFQCTGLEITSPEKPFDWKRVRHADDRPWPPRGVAACLRFESREPTLQGVAVTIRYELYDGVPVIGKSLRVENQGPRTIEINGLTAELLAVVEGESAVDTRADGEWRRPDIDVLSDYMFRGMDPVTANRVARWTADPSYETQVNYERKTPCLLVCEPPLGPGRRLAPGESFASFRVFLVVHDSTERERQGLTLRRAWRVLAPWTTENPLMMHVLRADRESFRRAVDQCAEVGFEMIIYTFGSGLKMENDDPQYLAAIKEDVDYAHTRGVQVGGYSLFSSRSIDAENDAINPATGKPGGAIFGKAPCLCSRWGQSYDQQIRRFIEQTGLDLLEHDGPYPGDVCASTSHPGHRGLDDSQWNQWEAARDLYRWCRERGVYVNQPDCYFLAGGSKTAMGYRETNWSLPRAQQLVHARQHIFDGTWTKTGSMGWMFVPLTQYHGGGAEATIEPLEEHQADYEAHLAVNLGAGVQACWRGPRLYDGEATRTLVTRWVAWFKRHRAILESDIIHARRADGREPDYIVHVNPNLPERGLAVVYNPLAEVAARKIRLPLYYTGLVDRALLSEQDGEAKLVPLDRQGRAEVEVRIPAGGMTWFVVTAAQ